MIMHPSYRQRMIWFQPQHRLKIMLTKRVQDTEWRKLDFSLWLDVWSHDGFLLIAIIYAKQSEAGYWMGKCRRRNLPGLGGVQRWPIRLAGWDWTDTLTIRFMSPEMLFARGSMSFKTGSSQFSMTSFQDTFDCLRHDFQRISPRSASKGTLRQNLAPFTLLKHFWKIWNCRTGQSLYWTSSVCGKWHSTTNGWEHITVLGLSANWYFRRRRKSYQITARWICHWTNTKDVLLRLLGSN